MYIDRDGEKNVKFSFLCIFMSKKNRNTQNLIVFETIIFVKE